MKIEFSKSQISNISNYVELYRRCFSNYPKKRNELYLDWLYNKNPVGKFIGIDAFDSDKGIQVGQVGGITCEFNYAGQKIKVLQPVNVCVDKDYRGYILFSKMAKRLEEYAIDENYSLIIGVSNRLATAVWQRSISMKVLTQLDVLFGYGNLGIDNLKLNDSIFHSLWDEQKINWRRANPYNKVFVNKKKKIKLISPSVLSIFDIFSYIEDDNYHLDFDKNKINFLPNFFIGLVPNEAKKNFFFRVPEFLKPSPLNFIYKDISKNNNIILEKEKCFFTYLDFDAY